MKKWFRVSVFIPAAEKKGVIFRDGFQPGEIIYQDVAIDIEGDKPNDYQSFQLGQIADELIKETISYKITELSGE